ncbi:NmrA family NAD(P)-binding protein [Paenibacillus favisporus]|uniref:NmrA family NAD(P)-binding protein n=1 Tax=Paenibacillus favisporus TaxID=221028 RepID=UPI003D2CB5F2
MSKLEYWNDKWEIEELVRNAGFKSWTILRPTWVMENLAQPAAQFMFPELKKEQIYTVLNAETHLDMVAAEDVGAFGRAALEDPIGFNGKNIDLAGYSITMNEVAFHLSHFLGKKIKSVSLLPSEALSQGLHPSVVNSQAYRNKVGFQVDIEKLKQYGIPLTKFESWARKNISNIDVE